MSGILFSEENMRLPPIIRTIAQPLLAILLSLPALAQQTAPSIPSTGFSGLDQYRVSRISIYTDDFGQLARYREADAALAPPAPAKAESYFLATRSPTTGSYQTIFLASPISTAASMGKPRLRCWCVSARM